MMTDAEQVIRLLQLQPHYEGGWFRFMWKNDLTVPVAALPAGYPGDRSLTSVIFYLLKQGERSRWHQLRGDEFWFWQGGGALEMHLSADGGRTVSQVIKIGPDIERGQQLTAHVPRTLWQTTAVCEGDYALVSCVVSPGFEDEDFRLPPDGRSGGG